MTAPQAIHATISEQLEVTVTRPEVLRCLGYPRTRAPQPHVAEVLDQLWEQAGGLVTPRGIYRVVGAVAAEDVGMPEPSEVVGLGACTVGPDLEQEEQRLTREGQMLEALILDAYGSAAAEAAADAVNAKLCAVAQGWGFQLPPRISPGYGSWPIESQPALLSLLDAGEVGISLTEGCMMVPRKSVSFGVRFERELDPRQTGRRQCAGCDLADCAYRAVAAANKTA
jgi:hypothetical protein